eukprot:COSAG06_NODE_67198_length_252_cov_1.019608_1_plen_41_part_01
MIGAFFGEGALIEAATGKVNETARRSRSIRSECSTVQFTSV